MKGFELLHRIDMAKSIFTWIKLAKDQADVEDGEEWVTIGLDRDEFKERVKDWIANCVPPEWGLDQCEFNARWENEEGECILIVDEDSGHDMKADADAEKTV